jgi:hypothetical protein
MALMIRIRSWRTKRNERKAEKLHALTKKDTAEADRMRYDYGKGVGAQVQDLQHQGLAKHAGEEGKKHY